MQPLVAGPGPSSTRSMMLHHSTCSFPSRRTGTGMQHSVGNTTHHRHHRNRQQQRSSAIVPTGGPAFAGNAAKDAAALPAGCLAACSWQAQCSALSSSWHSGGATQQPAAASAVAGSSIHRPLYQHQHQHHQHHSLGSCIPRLQRQQAPAKPAITTSRAGRLTPPSASLAFAEPSVALSSSSASAGAASAAAAAAATAAGSLSLSKVVAVVLGYCVMAGSLFRSVPQIIKVVKHNSTEGLSLMSYLVELCCYTVVIAYNLSQGYGFNTFGEVVACWIQDIILIALVFKDRRTPLPLILLSVAAFSFGCHFLLSPSCPQGLLATMQASNIAVMALGSRLPQIILNMRRGNAGMLSVTTCLLNVAGNAARIFTTIVLTGDLLMLGGACSQGCLNTILLWQSVSTARARRAAAAAGTPAAATASSSSSSGVQQAPSVKQRHKQQQQPDVTGGPEAASGGFPALQPAT